MPAAAAPRTAGRPAQGRLTIGALARAAGVPVSTVRYYEREGLLRPAGRTPSNYRVYGPEAVERLRFVRAAQATGFTLEDVRALLDLHDGTAAPCAEVRARVEARLDDLERRLADLRRVRRTLRAARALCVAHEPEGVCAVLDGLEARARTGAGSPPPGRRGRSQPRRA